MTKPRAWPTNAKNARDRAAEEVQLATSTLQCLLDYLDDHVNLNQYEAAVVHIKAQKALIQCQTALRHLESVGAPTQPH